MDAPRRSIYVEEVCNPDHSKVFLALNALGGDLYEVCTVAV